MFRFHWTDFLHHSYAFTQFTIAHFILEVVNGQSNEIWGDYFVLKTTRKELLTLLATEDPVSPIEEKNCF